MLGERIKERRNALHLSQTQLAKKLHITQGAVSQWEKGITKPDFEMLDALEIALDTTISYLLGRTDDPSGRPSVEELAREYEEELLREAETSQRPLPANLRPLSSLHRQKVPLIGKVAAGIPIMAEQDYETYVDAPVGCDCALEIEGDSMVPTYQPGDIVYIKCQPVANEGAVAVVLIDDSATMKHIYHMGDMLMLTSDNQTYAPINVDPREHDYVAIYGIPVGYTRIYKKDPLKNVKKGL